MDTKYNNKDPAIIGTIIIRLFKQSSPENVVWQTAFYSMCEDTLPVRTTNNFNIRIGPGEVKTLHGLVRKTKDFDTAVTEHIDSSFSSDLTICPRLVSLKSPGTTVEVPVRVGNLSAHVIEIPPKSLLSSLNRVSVVDSWTPDISQKQENKSTSPTSLEDLVVQINRDRLTTDQLDKSKNVLSNWSHIFSTGPTDLGRADIVKHEIKLTDNTTFKEPYRRNPPGLYEEVRQHLKEMLDAGAIRPSKSPYSSNVVLVCKKRFCIDFRTFNSRTIKDAYSLPRIDVTVDTLIGAKYFSKLDLLCGYWQVEMEKKGQGKDYIHRWKHGLL